MATMVSSCPIPDCDGKEMHGGPDWAGCGTCGFQCKPRHWDALPRPSDAAKEIAGDMEEWLLCASEQYPDNEVAPMVLSRMRRWMKLLGSLAATVQGEVWVVRDSGLLLYATEAVAKADGHVNGYSEEVIGTTAQDGGEVSVEITDTAQNPEVDQLLSPALAAVNRAMEREQFALARIRLLEKDRGDMGPAQELVESELERERLAVDNRLLKKLLDWKPAPPSAPEAVECGECRDANMQADECMTQADTAMHDRDEANARAAEYADRLDAANARIEELEAERDAETDRAMHNDGVLVCRPGDPKPLGLHRDAPQMEAFAAAEAKQGAQGSGKYSGIEGFVHDLGATVRECIDCGCLTPGGPTRCKRCVANPPAQGDKTYEDELIAALRQVDKIRHEMKAMGRRSQAMQTLIEQLKDPCMVVYARTTKAASYTGVGGSVPRTGRMVLERCGDRKISVIKLVRAYLRLGLKDAKGLVDRVPSVLDDPATDARLPWDMRATLCKELWAEGCTVVFER